jgi:hypothetical protein
MYSLDRPRDVFLQQQVSALSTERGIRGRMSINAIVNDEPISVRTGSEPPLLSSSVRRRDSVSVMFPVYVPDQPAVQLEDEPITVETGTEPTYPESKQGSPQTTLPICVHSQSPISNPGSSVTSFGTDSITNDEPIKVASEPKSCSDIILNTHAQQPIPQSDASYPSPNSNTQEDPTQPISHDDSAGAKTATDVAAEENPPPSVSQHPWNTILFKFVPFQFPVSNTRGEKPSIANTTDEPINVRIESEPSAENNPCQQRPWLSLLASYVPFPFSPSNARNDLDSVTPIVLKTPSPPPTIAKRPQRRKRGKLLSVGEVTNKVGAGEDLNISETNPQSLRVKKRPADTIIESQRKRISSIPVDPISPLKTVNELEDEPQDEVSSTEAIASKSPSQSQPNLVNEDVAPSNNDNKTPLDARFDKSVVTLTNGNYFVPKKCHKYTPSSSN